MPNIELYKVRLENNDSTKAFYPHTSTDVVFDGKGNNLDSVLKGGLRPRNLIVNGDFQINQRGEITYYANGTDWIFTVDKWKINNHSKLYVNDGYIRFHKVDSNQQALLNQKVETKGKSVTVIKVKSINGTATVRFGDSTVTKTITQSGVFTIKNDVPISAIGIDLVTNGHYIDIEYIDIFEGDIAYPHIKKSYAEDLAECQRYLMFYDFLKIQGRLSYYDKKNNAFISDVFLPSTFLTKPTIKNGVAKIVYSDSSIVESDIQRFDAIIRENIVTITFKHVDVSKVFHDEYGAVLLELNDLEISCE